MNVLPQFMGTLVHNAWGTYFQLSAQHALCGAHLLRELRGLAEHHDQVWAGALRNALRTVQHQQNEGRLTPEIAPAFEHQFGVLLDAGLKANPPAAPVAGRRGQTKQSPGRNLALRCKQNREAVLRFLHDEGVPLRQQPSRTRCAPLVRQAQGLGGFRSEEGGQNFARIRSYISTLRKQGLNVWHGLVSVFRGDVIMPDFTR